MQKPSASVIICTRNRRDDIVACLNSLASQTYTDFELIVVDSSDTSLSVDPLFSQAVHVFKAAYTYVRSDPGLTVQRNKGIRLAAGDIVYFFDDDVILADHYLEVMQETFMQHPAYVGGMGSITNMQRQSSWFWQIIYATFLLPRDYASGCFTLSGMPTHAYGSTSFKTIECVGGCCMAFRRSMLTTHFFDEQLKRYAYMEDCDISWRIAQEGSLFYQPAARLAHNNSPVARDAAIENRAMFMRNYRYLYAKNVYPQNRFSLLAHWWSIVGLFFVAMVLRDTASLRGYVQGLMR